MTWNYRIVKYRDGSGFGLHEVYYDGQGEPENMTAEPADFVVDAEEGPDGIVRSLRMALVDAKRRGILDEPKEWPGMNPADKEGE